MFTFQHICCAKYAYTNYLVFKTLKPLKGLFLIRCSTSVFPPSILTSYNSLLYLLLFLPKCVCIAHAYRLFQCETHFSLHLTNLPTEQFCTIRFLYIILYSLSKILHKSCFLNTLKSRHYACVHLPDNIRYFLLSK